MKKVLITMTINMFATIVLGQSWEKGGNNPSANPFSLGSNSNDAIMFETGGVERMRILETTGYVGLNTLTPMCRLHSLDGDVVFESLLTPNTGPNTISTLPVTGEGYRLMWIDSLAAFRVGGLDNDIINVTCWDPDQIGRFSVAMGRDVRASGYNSFALGTTCRTTPS